MLAVGEARTVLAGLRHPPNPITVETASESTNAPRTNDKEILAAAIQEQQSPMIRYTPRLALEIDVIERQVRDPGIGSEEWLVFAQRAMSLRKSTAVHGSIVLRFGLPRLLTHG